MSELKDHRFCECDEIVYEYRGQLSNEMRPYYLKYEADKVIAELKADYQEACDRLQTANLIKDEQLAATRHSKYKRCLAMANYWVAVSYHCVDDKHRQSAVRHHRKWLELAEKFKDKETK